MPEGLSLQVIVLLAIPVATLLAALAFAAGHRRAEARRARASLGRAARAIDEASLGERVLVQGIVESVAGPCPRFEDGAPCAAATVESCGRRASPNATAESAPPDVVVGVTHSTRAASIVINVASERLVVLGPIDVFVGSIETDPAALFAELAAPVRERIAAVADHEALPAACADGPVHARPLFRSLYQGDSIHVAGTLAKQSEGDRTGYRERASWVIHGDSTTPVILAYAGTPRHRGALAARLRGVRPFTRRGLVAAVVPAMALALCLKVTLFHPAPSPAATHAPKPTHMMASHFADQTRCAALQKEYNEWTKRHNVCASDSDCTAEVRGGAYFGLEGCYRFRNSTASESTVESIETAWLDEGCATTYEICPERPAAMCRQGICGERPPSPIPDFWNREDSPGAIFLYIPPELKRAGGIGDDSAFSHYEGGGIKMAIDYTEADTFTSNEDDPGKPMTVGGNAARVWRNDRSIRVLFQKIKPCIPPRCSASAEGDALVVYVNCESNQACENAWMAIESLRFW